ncbi:MAG: hypothetical protein IKP73_00045 [Bacteroidales bacterium]|nr:hypothetical protein [Bacteroidales bacterium]
MCLNHAICKFDMKISKIVFKTVIFIAVLIFRITTTSAQEYNNWLLSGGAVLNFDTSPATIRCNYVAGEVFHRHVGMLSDEDGRILLYAYKTEPDNNNTIVSDFVIKNRDNQMLVSVSCSDLKNTIGCNLSQGGYFFAFVIRKPAYGELHVCQFNTKGEFIKDYVYDNGNYTFLIDFIRLGDCIALVAYKTKRVASDQNQIEVYKLTSDGCHLWSTTKINLDPFSFINTPLFCIGHTMDSQKIVAGCYDVTYVLNLGKDDGSITIVNKIASRKLSTFSFSKTDKYFLIIDENKLKGYLFDENFDLNYESPDMVYDLSRGIEVNYNYDWTMAVGVDGKLYIHNQTTNSITVLDGVEEGNIVEETISSDCLTVFYFPHIIRQPFKPSCRASASFDNAIACHGQPLKILSSGDAPFDISYTIDGEEHSIKTTENSYQLPDVPGKYVITKIKDASCETVPTVNNTAEIAPEMRQVRIVEE